MADGILARAACGAAALTLLIGTTGMPSHVAADEALNARVQRFLDEHRRDWRDLNVPYEDGKILHDLIVGHGCTGVVEIGTSTGHSTIWIAWAMSKTGGKVWTIEIDEARYAEARRNVADAGLTDYVELVLGDAHALVPA